MSELIATDKFVGAVQVQRGEIILHHIESGQIEQIWFENNSVGTSAKNDLREFFIKGFNEGWFEAYQLPFPGDVLFIKIKSWDDFVRLSKEVSENERTTER